MNFGRGRGHFPGGPPSRQELIAQILASARPPPPHGAFPNASLAPLPVNSSGLDARAMQEQRQLLMGLEAMVTAGRGRLDTNFLSPQQESSNIYARLPQQETTQQPLTASKKLEIPPPGAPLPSRDGIPTTLIKEPHPHDVLFGCAVNHTGNDRYRELVQLQRVAYLQSSQTRKVQISQAIVRAVRAQNPPGRFLELDMSTTGLWYDIGDDKAREQTIQALEGSPPTDMFARILPPAGGIHGGRNSLSGSILSGPPTAASLAATPTVTAAVAATTLLRAVTSDNPQDVAQFRRAEQAAAANALAMPPPSNDLVQPNLRDVKQQQLANDSRPMRRGSGNGARRLVAPRGRTHNRFRPGMPSLPGFGRGRGIFAKPTPLRRPSKPPPPNSNVLMPPLQPASDELHFRLVLAETLAQRTVRGTMTPVWEESEKKLGLYMDAGLLGIDIDEMAKKLASGQSESEIVEEAFKSLQLKEEDGDKKRPAAATTESKQPDKKARLEEYEEAAVNSLASFSNRQTPSAVASIGTGPDSPDDQNCAKLPN